MNTRQDLSKKENTVGGKMEDSAVSKETGDVQQDNLPPIPGKHYFTIGEMGRICQIKPHVLRYWEHEFSQLSNVKRRGNRRYYTRQQVILVRQIRSLLYEQGYTISGAKARMEGGEDQQDSTLSRQLIKQIKSELEEILITLRM